MVAYIGHCANAATNLVPNYGIKSACTFVASLISETAVRFLSENGLTVEGTFLLKGPQIASCLLSNPAFSSYPAAISTAISTLFLFSPWCFNAVLNLSNFQWLGKKPSVQVAILIADRPPLVSIYASAVEIANIASKVINSLAVGLVAQKVFTGQTKGKICMVVSAALLTLSACNVYYRKKVDPKN